MSVSTAAIAILLAGTDPVAIPPETPTADTPVIIAEEVLETQPAAPPPLDSGTIVVTGSQEAPKSDPLEAVNEQSFKAVQAVDAAIVAPVAQHYEEGVPKPVRKGFHNFLRNLDEPVAFLHFLLQLKPGKAMETLGRFAINTTLGLGGLIDVAKRDPINLPHRPNGLANTLGYYGVGPGPYLVLPLIGSTTLRDVFGRVVDLSVLPMAVGKPLTEPAVVLAKGTLSSIDDRVEQDDVLTRIQNSEYPYQAMREYYLTRRQAEIDVLKGRRADANISLDEIESYRNLEEEDRANQPVTPEPAPATEPAPLELVH